MGCGIYAITNKVNNKVYIGQSVRLKIRESEHFGSLDNNNHYNRYLQRSWNTHGGESFHFKALEFCSQEELNEREIYYISKYNSSDSDYGYNFTEGGGGSVGFKHTEETKRLISEMQIGKKISKEARRRMSEAKKGKTPKNIQILLDHIEDSKEPIIQLDKAANVIGEWDSIQGCARALDIFATNIVKNLKGHYKTCGGFVFVYKEDWENGLISKEEISSRFKKRAPIRDSIIKLSLELEYIGEEKSITAYSRKGYNKNKVAHCCKGLLEDYSGFKWMYKKDYEEYKKQLKA